jgi:hypothetical protein
VISLFYHTVTTSQFGAKEKTMQYVVSGAKVCGKLNGEKLTTSDILSAGGSVEHLLASGNIKESTNTPKAVKEVEAVEAVQQVVDTLPVFNLDNEQGEKPWQE